MAFNFEPVSGQTHVFTPSPEGYGTPGVHSSVVGSQGTQAIKVHDDSLLIPLAAQTQELQPSADKKTEPGQQKSRPKEPARPIVPKAGVVFGWKP